MRRKDRERSNPEFIGQVLDEAEEIFVAMRDGDYPYGVILNFARENEYIYAHSALAGKKLDLLTADPHVAFCAACGISIDTEKSSTYYRSVYGRGKAEIVRDSAEKRHALDLIARRYGARCPLPSSEKQAARVAIIRIAIEEASGKTCEREGPGAPRAVKD